MVRSTISDRTKDFIENPNNGRGRGGHVGTVDAPPSPWQGGGPYGPVEYWPPTMHPKYIFPKDVLA